MGNSVWVYKIKKEDELTEYSFLFRFYFPRKESWKSFEYRKRDLIIWHG